MYKVLIVEDDAAIAAAIQGHLISWGYQVKTAADFQNVLLEFTSFLPDIVLMDISLPFYNGFHWCMAIRRLSKVPILFLSSASDNLNQVMAMQMGADDFIAKPFDLSLLTAKTQALLRRTYEFHGETHLMRHGEGVLNLSDATFTFQGQSVSLTKNEWRILEALMHAGGAVVSRDAIMKRLWETDCFIDDNTLSVNVNRLRKTLESVGLCDYIETKKGVGYRVV